MIQVSEIAQIVNITVDEITESVNITVTDISTPINLQVSEIGLQGIQGVPGVPGVAGQDAVLPIKIYQEVPTGLVNGINATFVTLNNFVAGTLELFLNGSLQKIVSDYQLTGSNTILLTAAPTTAENILINYIKQ